MANGVVYFGSADNFLYALDAVTGTELWQYQLDASIESSPTVIGGIVYVGTNTGTLYAITGETQETSGRSRTTSVSITWELRAPLTLEDGAAVPS